MKNKSFLVGVTILVSLGSYIYLKNENPSKKQDMAAKKIEKAINHTAPNAILDKNFIGAPSSVEKNYAIKIEETKDLVPSIEDMSKEFETIDDKRLLKLEYEKSSALVKKLQLLEKANKQALNDKELVVFTTELRRQGVIGLRLAELELRKQEGK